MERMKRLGVLAGPSLILLAGAAPAFAQGGQGNGTLVGTVVDNVGVIPGATITATHVATNATPHWRDERPGRVPTPALPPGRYTVKVEMDGFRPVTIREFNLLGGEVRDARPAGDDGWWRDRIGDDHGGSHAGADGQQRPVAQHHG